MRGYVLAISQGAGFIYGDGVLTNREGTVVVSLNDGIRPAIFKVEGIDVIAGTWNEGPKAIRDQHKDPESTSTK